MDTIKKVLSSLASDIDRSLSSDRFRFSRRLRELQKRIGADKPSDRALEKLQTDVKASCELAAARRRKVPVIEYPEQLPVSAKKEAIATAIKEHQVVILAGETGSGKTTQIPKICLELGRGVTGLIGHTQPRRIAARTVASRIAEELKSPLGESVGYQVRFTDHSNPHTHIKLMTDGILLAEIQNDRFLNRYDTLIIDEAHERSLNIDFLLGYLKTILPKRPDLKVIITSATIDVERFSTHFDDAPIISVSGRTYPVELLYRPMLDEQENQYEAIVEAIGEILSGGGRQNQGDILVFLSGEREIREAANAIRKAQFAHLDVLPLYARLSLADQNRVFQAHRGRRVVLATNVAETSITVPGIRYVIDPGFARVSRYSYRTKVQRLPVEAISQASANQRKGRCGRVSDGICIRLYEETDFNNRPEFTDAEILRTNLGAVILQMLKLRIGDIREFPFIDRPDQRLINDGYRLLEELQAVDKKGNLTRLGHQLAVIPLDPRLARMLIAAKELGCMRELLIICSALSVQDPRERPADKQQAADEKHHRFRDDHSDFLAYINLWNYFEQQRQDLTQNQFRKQCKKDFLSYLRLREWRDIHYQLRLACLDAGEKENTEPAAYETVHQALLSGLLGNIGFRSEEKEYSGARNRRFAIFPGSSQFKKAPKWLMSAQLLETSKLYAHTVAKIDPQWVLKSAGHLVKRHYFEPHYDSRSGQVMAYEKVSLYGLILVEKQRISYAKIDPVVAHDVFMRAALVEGKYKGKGKFFAHNQQLIREVTELEAKSRRRDILAADSVLFDFYSERVPGDIVNQAGFEHWRKQAEKDQPNVLYIDKDQLMRHDAAHVTEAQFPNELTLDGITYKLSYQFEPGHKEDGVSIHVPVSVLHLVPEERLQWLVPGLLKEKCVNLVKSLPKQWRRHFVPVPAFVDKALVGMKADNTPLTEALGFQLKRHSGVEIPADTWHQVAVENYYRFNIKVLDENRRTIDSGRDLATLRERYRDQLKETVQAVDNNVEQDGITQWIFESRPETIELERGGVQIRAYLALEDEGDSIAIRVHDNPLKALCLTRRGVTRLLLLEMAHTVKYLSKNLLKGKDIGLSVTSLGNRQAVIDDLLCAACADLCLDNKQSQVIDAEDLPATKEAFIACAEAARAQLTAHSQAYETLLLSILESVVAIKKTLKSTRNALSLAFAASDINHQLQQLIYPGFLYETPFEWLQQYPRYLKAILARLDKASANHQKDKLSIAQIEPLWERLQEQLDNEGREVLATNEPLLTYRWMIEELRVSLFAQTLKTRMPISVKRLDKQWQLCSR